MSVQILLIEEKEENNKTRIFPEWSMQAISLLKDWMIAIRRQKLAAKVAGRQKRVPLKLA